MRTYVVRANDSPGSIAATFAGCPKCSNLLIKSNPQKATVRYPNGFVTFKELHVGEVLNLPDAWFDGTLDRQPQSYFAALPYADGVTPGVGQAPTAAPSQASQAVLDIYGFASLAAKAIAADPNYCTSIAQAGSPVNEAVHNFKEAWNRINPAAAVPIGTGTLEPVTTAAMATVIATVPAPCAGGVPTQLPPVAVAEREGLSTGAAATVIGLVAAVVVGTVVYEVSRPRRRFSSWHKPSNFRRSR